MSQRALVFTLVAAIAAVYPFLIYFGLSEYGIRTLAICLLVILSLRVLLWQQFKKPEKIALLLLIFLLCGLAAWLRSEAILRYYPVLMNLGFGGVFLLSLRTEQPLIERLMSLVIKDLPPRAIRYLRGLTLAWGIILIINAIISFYTACCLSLQHWTIYNGAIVYLIFGAFALAELVYRHYYKKRHPQE
ncbi:MAG: septation protein IspZ [Acidiferrobacterales bacterium]|nr:septation protein IspZ [Acidiferrobacterales bacterium]